MTPAPLQFDPPTRIVVSLTHAVAPLGEQIERAAAAGADWVELRVDLIGDLDAVRDALRRPSPRRRLLTIRSRAEGGAWDDDESARVALIEALGLLGPDCIDVEWQAWRRSANLRQKIGLVCRRTDGLDESAGLRGKSDLLLSLHDLSETPPDLDPVLAALEREPAAICKAVFTASDSLDSLRVLEQLCRRAARRAWVLLAMGEAGLVTRVLARKFGGFATFAALEAGRAAAPGQIPVHELRQRYRWDAIGARTRVLGVLGWPVRHSRSPAIHNAALGHDGIDAVYLPLPVRPDYDAFARFMDFVRAASWLDPLGFSVTIPHKEHALRWLRERGLPATPAAGRCGAVNTLIGEPGGGWRGDNTDVTGVQAALQARGLASGDGRTALVLGAGGVSRAAIVALQSDGWRIVLANRSSERAAALAHELGVRVIDWEQREREPCQLVVNGTSVGMTPDVHQSPLSTDFWRRTLADGRPPAAFDTVYNPERTRFLREAAAAGAITISGVEMFLTQAGEQYRLWHGRPAPLDVMRAALP